jgi:hypothetical protein
MANTRGNRATGTNTGPDDIARALRDEQIMEHRIASRSYSEIAGLVGCAKSTVYESLKRSIAALGASPEMVDEYRNVQNERCEALQAKLWPHLMRPLRDDDGAIVRDPATSEPMQTPDNAVFASYVRLMERQAKLLGLDLERSPAGRTPITAEALAEFLGWDVSDAPIDVNGEELHDAPALEPGADPR